MSAKKEVYSCRIIDPNAPKEVKRNPIRTLQQQALDDFVWRTNLGLDQKLK